MEIIEKQQKNKQNSHDAMKTIEMQQKNITNKHKTKKNSKKNYTQKTTENYSTSVKIIEKTEDN